MKCETKIVGLKGTHCTKPKEWLGKLVKQTEVDSQVGICASKLMGAGITNQSKIV
jgi:hypothetical protein